MTISRTLSHNIWSDLQESIKFGLPIQKSGYNFIPPLIGQNIAFTIGIDLNTYSTDIEIEDYIKL